MSFDYLKELFEWAWRDIVFLIGLFFVGLFFVKTKKIWYFIAVMILIAIGWFMIASPFIALILAFF